CAAVAGAATASAGPATPTAVGNKKDGDKKGGDKKDGDKKDGDRAPVAKVAASLGVSVQRLTTALGNLKQALAKGVDKAAAVDAFARELGVSRADADKALQALSTDGPKKPPNGKEPVVPEEVVTSLAAELRISVDAARGVFKELAKVNGNGRDVVKDPAFIAIAKKLGIAPQRLFDALVKVKQEYGGKAEKKAVPSGSTAK
ncbi:MAG TPA: hypothetical protein VFT95_05230, partial [Micromonosporaceae bacterium]|nr:hypothetical protein [Micromonosporaceae bacterium]